MCCEQTLNVLQRANEDDDDSSWETTTNSDRTFTTREKRNRGHERDLVAQRYILSDEQLFQKNSTASQDHSMGATSLANHHLLYRITVLHIDHMTGSFQIVYDS